MTKRSLVSPKAEALTVLGSLVVETSELSSLFDDLDPRDTAGDLCVAQTWTRLRLAVSDSGLKQSEIASKLNVKPSVVSRWLSGKQNIGIRHLAALAWAIDFELDIDFLNQAGKRVTQLRSYARLDYFVSVSITPASPTKFPTSRHGRRVEMLELTPVGPAFTNTVVKIHA